MVIFHTAKDEDIKEGRSTDIYFSRAKKVLVKEGIKKRVIVEITAGSLPNNYPWGVLSGIEEVTKLLEGINIDVYSLPEGSIFQPYQPVLRLEGEYTLFAELETAILGFICQSSGISTKAARFRKAAKKKYILSFGIRRMHPSISPMIDRAAYIGGVDGFSGVAAQKLIGKKATGTMPHAFVLIVGDQIKAWKLYDKGIHKSIPRIALVDTLYDEKAESIMAAENVKDIFGVRLDTPESRRGNMNRIVEEVRWELDIRGYENVKIFVSGGIDEDNIPKLNKVWGFGIGTSISNSKIIDFAMDIVEIEGKPISKRGKLSGKKEVFRCTSCLNLIISYNNEITRCTSCKGRMENFLKPIIKDGKIVANIPKVEEIRNYVLKQLQQVNLDGL
jgi:nicotinate phosphoribosyltransferase|tara:strand:- start:17224 stop:18390 length:1167 start_codon:yes stop_codon:yes gene_type:complete